MNKIYKLFVLSMVIMFAFGCKKNSGAEVKKIVLDSERKVSTKNSASNKSASTKTEETKTKEMEKTLNEKLDRYIKTVDKKSKVEEMICSGIYGTKYDKKMEDFLKATKPGSIILFKRNISSEKQLKALVLDIRALYKNMNVNEPFIFVDEEGGRVDRLKSVYGKTNSPSWYFKNKPAAEYGKRITNALNHFDFNGGFSPVLDTQKPGNGIIGDRAFSDNYESVAKYARDVIDYMNKNNIVSVGKHFPGHGATYVDSHKALPIINKSYDELLKTDLIPFKKNFDILPGVMVAHILVPKVDNLPASLSKVWMGKIRDEYKFDGIVFSDDLTMGALDSYGDLKTRARKFVESGGDIPLVCHKNEEMAGVISELLKVDDSRIDDSYKRIIKLKLEIGLISEIK